MTARHIQLDRMPAEVCADPCAACAADELAGFARIEARDYTAESGSRFTIRRLAGPRYLLSWGSFEGGFRSLTLGAEDLVDLVAHAERVR